MTAQELRQVVQKFADRPVDVEIGERTLMAELQGQIVEVSLKQSGGLLYCIEGGREELAEQWVIRRLGNLDILANRILEFVQQDNMLVPVRAKLTGVSDDEGKEVLQSMQDVVKELPTIVNGLPAASTNVIYLTSDAGEGKTCVMEALARFQARAFLDRQTDWLLLPIGLAGRPFMRLDEVIVAALANHFRFRYLYYEALLELVKRKAVVLGLDGFEEMFIESQTGEVASSLGNLVARLESQGTMIFAARKAYYRYSNFQAQAKLFKSIRDMNVAFGEVRLERWKREQFILCCERFGLAKAEANTIYENFSRRLPSDHPVLTRAVLARRAIHEVVEGGGESRLACILGNDDTSPESVFEKFIHALIEREALQKWIDRTGEAATPLLSPDEHLLLLMELAQEMWLAGAEILSWDALEAATEVVVSEFGKGPSTIRQAKERIRQHALLQKGPIDDTYGFDHEEFRAYFLGRSLSLLLDKGLTSDVRRFLSVRMLPELTVRIAVQSISRKSMEKIIELLHTLASSGTKASFSRINAAVLLVRVISANALLNQQLRDMYFPSGVLVGVNLSNITFEECIFENITITDRPFKNISFKKCTIVELICPLTEEFNSGCFDAASVPEITRTGLDDLAESHYSPQEKRNFLKTIGFTILDDSDSSTSISVPEMDARVNDVEKVVRAFRKATQVNQGILAVRLGRRWNEFEKSVLPDLLQNRILVEVNYEGHGRQRRFKLGVGFDDVDRARHLCEGSYDIFLQELTES